MIYYYEGGLLMSIKIVTDSGADLPTALTEELDVTVVPVYLRFGQQVYRDRVDINEDEFYQRLLKDPVHPNTTQPSPQDFANVYEKLSQEADGIISIHITSKLSGTYNSAVQGKKMVNNKCPIDIIDSQNLSIAVGLMVILASKMASSGISQEQIVAELEKITPNMHLLILFDTLKYLVKGGRIGKAKGLVGSVLNVKPLLAVRDGELVPSGQVRTRSKGIDRLLDFVKNAKEIQDLAILHSTTADEAQALVERTNSIFPKDQTLIARLGPGLGVHGGPGILAVALRGEISHGV
jgi:DegV family protein with EDD domain